MRSIGRAVETVLGTFALYVFIQGAVLFFYRLTPVTALASLVAAAALSCAIWVGRYPKVRDHEGTEVGRGEGENWWFAGVAALGDLALIAYALTVRSDEALRSPWDLLPLPAIVIFAVSTWTLLLHRREGRNRLTAPLVTLHLFTAWSVAEIVYALGFGFDPFIHRTAESHIAAQGFLLPKQPFYNGQYAAVLGLHWLTGASIDLIDRWLVPTLASLTLPWIMRRQGFWTLGILLIPLLPFTFTTPNNLAAVFLAWTVFSEGPLAIVAAMAAFAAHPLIGTPALVLAVGRWLMRRVKRPRVVAWAVFAAASVAVPSMLVLHNIKQGAVAFVSGPLTERWQLFVGLFVSPYRPFLAGSIDGWDFLYAWHALMPLLLLVFSVIGARMLWRKDGRVIVSATAAVAAGTLAATAIMSVGIIVPGIISHEQSEFSLRLVHALAVIAAPLFLAGLDAVFRPALKGLLSPRKAMLMFGLAVAMTAAWLMSYPQANKNADFNGWGVSRADFEAARSITEDAQGRTYVALSNQMLSVAALRMNGFQDFSYALPTGGRLYEYFLIMAYGRTERSTMEEMMRETGVDRSYFVIHAYEPGFDWLRETATGIADAAWPVDNGRIWVFGFSRTR